MGLSDEDWEELLYAIKDKKCTPFIGAGACAPWLPLGSEIARDWASKHDYPLGDSHQLARIAQFLAIKEDNDMYPKNILNRILKEKRPPDFRLEEHRDTPYVVLADLNLPIYITTNYDHFMEAALKSKGKDPVSEFCRWNKAGEAGGIISVFDREKQYMPREARPLVYHLHGIIDKPQSMVLTEDDYIDFIVALSSNNDIIPPAIRQLMTTSPLLFIGYSLEDINFRTIFRGIVDYLGARYQLASMAVLLTPKGVAENKQNEAQKYLERYTRKMFNIRVYWGTANEFSSALRKRWNEFISRE
jgi:SIR2-like protein